MAAHSGLTGSNLHEPKGADTSAVNKVYVANGSGSGTWQKLAAAQMDTTSIFGVNTVALTFTFKDLATASTQYIVIPFAGTCIRVYTALQGAITTADAGLTVKNAAGVAMTGGTITITQSGSAAGDIDSCTPSANNTFSAGTTLRITNDGAADTSVDAVVTLTFTVTGAYA